METFVEQNFNKDKALDFMSRASYPIIAAPWFDTPIMIKVRNLDYVKIRSCGNFSLIDLDPEKTEKQIEKMPFESLIKILNYQEAITKLALVSPTFKEIENMIKARDPEFFTDTENRIKVVEKKIESLPAGEEKKKLQEELSLYKLRLAYVLPQEFMAFITDFVTGNGRTDIKKITREMLLEAQSLSIQYGGPPSQYLEGEFTEYNKRDIDRQAGIVYQEFLEDQKRVKGGGFRGGKVRK
jgi:hypothetical protein